MRMMLTLKITIKEVIDEEEERIAACSSGRDYPGRHPSRGRPVRHGRCEGPRGIAPDGSRHSGRAEASLCCHVPEGFAPIWQHSGILDAPASRIRSEESGAKQEDHATRRADNARETGPRTSRLTWAPPVSLLRAADPALVAGIYISSAPLGTDFNTGNSARPYNPPGKM